jgi:hypothetical protein
LPQVDVVTVTISASFLGFFTDNFNSGSSRPKLSSIPLAVEACGCIAGRSKFKLTQNTGTGINGEWKELRKEAEET